MKYSLNNQHIIYEKANIAKKIIRKRFDPESNIKKLNKIYINLITSKSC